MRGRGIACACLLTLLVGCVDSVWAESNYDALCTEQALVQEDTSAWIEIPETEFCLPVMQRLGDDGFYADHGADGTESETGALYTQSTYNNSDFSDPVTIIYGSSSQEGAPFRNLQEMYSGKFDECGKILLHLPTETLEYEVFAAVPYSSAHILYYYDFDTESRFEEFFDGVYSLRKLGMHLDEGRKPVYGNQILILSTGLRGDRMQRYLVMAKLATD